LADKDQVETGALACSNCSNWFRIQNGIAVLLPLSLDVNDRRERFAREYGFDLNLASDSGPADKLSQIHFFDQDIENYDRDIINSTYYQALEEIGFLDWVNRNLSPGQTIVDIGCGSGRQILPLVRQGLKTIGADISEEMATEALRKVKIEGLGGMVNLIVCDCENIPLKPGFADGCVMNGVLHHVSRPDLVINNAAKLLKKGGAVFSCEPHKSPARFIFDLSMKIWKLHDEEAGEGSLITEKQMQELMLSSSIQGQTSLSTYLLPHIFKFLNKKSSVRLLKATDRLFGRLPLIRKLGGMVMMEGRMV
jgi:ubiquinone/menaquinone biosynthesis C-methylase UbiE